MGDRTEIAWADVTWNPVTGCRRVSTGCDNCYIERTPPFRMVGRAFRDHNGDRSRAPGSTTGVTLHEDRVDQPLRKPSWRGRRVFVCSLADLFHKDVPAWFLARVWARMAMRPDVTFQVLTKRSARMRSLLLDPAFMVAVHREIADAWPGDGWHHSTQPIEPGTWPLPNVWLGVTAEYQPSTRRIPNLCEAPAAVRWVSCEPLLGPVELNPSGLDWVVIGGESGPGARPMREEWARSLVKQCRAVGVPVFIKQLGGKRDKRGRLEDLPEDLRIREWPTPTPQDGQRG